MISFQFIAFFFVEQTVGKQVAYLLLGFNFLLRCVFLGWCLGGFCRCRSSGRLDGCLNLALLACFLANALCLLKDVFILRFNRLRTFHLHLSTLEPALHGRHVKAHAHKGGLVVKGRITLVNIVAHQLHTVIGERLAHPRLRIVCNILGAWFGRQFIQRFFKRITFSDTLQQRRLQIYILCSSKRTNALTIFYALVQFVNVLVALGYLLSQHLIVKMSLDLL